MLNVLGIVIYSIVVLIALLLIALVLVQPSKGGGFGAAFGGIGESVFGAQAMGHLAKLTVVMISLFFVLTLALAVISGHQNKAKDAAENSMMKSLGATATASEVQKTASAAVPEKKLSVKENIPAVPAADRKK